MLASRLKLIVIGVVSACVAVLSIYLYGMHIGNAKCNISILKTEIKNVETNQEIDRAVDRMGADTVDAGLMYWVRGD